MADDEQFSLCWNNFNSNLSAGFHESLCRGDLVDVTLAAEGQFVKAHRLVLSVCSPYFRKMFTQMPANQHAFVFLKDVSHSALKDLIQFMYCGEVNVKQEALPAFISTAEALQIKGLTDSDPPASQSPAEPSTPIPQQIASPRVRQRTQTQRSTYKIDTLDDNGDKIQQPTQIVIQTTTAPPQATITQQTQHLQTLNQQQHVTTPIVSTGTTTTVVTHKRPAQRNTVGGSAPHIKRTKSTIDPLEMSEITTAGTGSTSGTQQITVQTAVVSAAPEPKSQHTSDTEYIDLPMEISTKAEPDYSEEAGDVDGTDNDGAAYVEDDSYGEVRYDENYFTENEDGPTTATVAVTSGTATGGVTTATTSKTIVKQQAASFSDSSYVEAGDQTNSDAQVRKKQAPILLNSSLLLKSTCSQAKRTSNSAEYVSSNLINTRYGLKKQIRKASLAPTYSQSTAVTKTPSKIPDIPDGTIIKTSANDHHLTVLRKSRLFGRCVSCLKASSGIKTHNLPKIVTHCPQCPGGQWMCEPCFDREHQFKQEIIIIA